MAAAIDEEAVIRKRYLTQTALVGTADPPFKKLVKKYMEFTQRIEGGGSLEEAEKVYSGLLADLYAVQFSMQKHHAQAQAFERDQQAYADKQAQLQASIQQAELDIEDRKRELVEARVELAHKQEYEAVRKQVMQVPSRPTTLAEQEGANREIADLQQQSAALDLLFQQRKQQFAGVLAALEQVHRSIEREEPEDVGAAATAALQEGGNGGGGSRATGAAAAAAPPQQQRQAMQVG